MGVYGEALFASSAVYDREHPFIAHKARFRDRQRRRVAQIETSANDLPRKLTAQFEICNALAFDHLFNACGLDIAIESGEATGKNGHRSLGFGLVGKRHLPAIFGRLACYQAHVFINLVSAGDSHSADRVAGDRETLGFPGIEAEFFHHLDGIERTLGWGERRRLCWEAGRLGGRILQR